MPEIVIVGGGASGLFAGIAAAEKGAFVTILEMDQKPAAKLLRTGNGRCNYTNTGTHAHRYHGAHPEFAEEVLTRFSPEDTIAWFETFGILPYRAGDWVYPHSETASSVAEALLRRARELGIKIKNTERATHVERRDGRFVVFTKTWQYPADRVILSCGTDASMKPELRAGLERLPKGLRAVPYEPTLCAMKVKERDCAKWAGVRVHAEAALLIGGREVHRERGQIQFARDGVSGIAVFNMASDVREALKIGKRAEIVLDLAPEYTSEELTAYLKTLPGRTELCLEGILPKKLIPFVMKQVSGAEKAAAAGAVKHFSLTPAALSDLTAAQAAAGGILTDQIDPDTMMVRTIPGLYVTGEMLDIDGECGGWNLQFAWASGYLAGTHAAQSSKLT